MIPYTFLTTTVQAGDTIANTATATPFATQGYTDIVGLATPAVNDYDYGRAFRITAFGLISTLATPGTLTMSVQHKGSSSNQAILGTTGAFTPPASLSAAGWWMDGIAVWGVTGASGLAKFDGMFTIIGAANAPTMYPLIASGSGTADMVADNSTLSTNQALQLYVQWATASASNTITAQQICFERIN